MLKKITFSAIFFLLALCCNAQNGKITINKTLPTWLQKVATVDKKPEYKNIQDGYYIFLSERQNNLETKEEYTHIIRQISSSTGVQNASEISIAYDPSYEKLIFHKLIIWRDNKPIEKLNPQNFKILQNEKELSRFIYSGLFTAYAVLDDVRKGDRIEYAFTLSGHNPVFTKYANTLYLQGSSQFVNVYNNIIFNPARTIKTKNFNQVPEVKKSVVNGLNVFEWQSTMSASPVYNDNEPAHYDPYARVQISEYGSWKEIVDWGLNLKKYDLKNSKILNDKIAELKSKSNNNKEKYFQLATRFVQDEIRYMGIEIGEYSHRPNAPDKILNQRYGDCKDKSTLLCHLLNENGIIAYPVYLNTYLAKQTTQLLPSPTIFNHEVVMVEFNDKPIYIDPTMSDQRGPITENYFPYDANVLIIRAGENKLETTSSQILGKIKVNSVFKVADTLAKNKTKYNITTVYTKNFADNFRSELSSEGADNLEKSYVEYYANLYPGLVASAPVSINDNETENIITVKESYEIDKLWNKKDEKSSRLLAYFYGEVINGQLKSIKNYRDAPFKLAFPSTVEQQIKIILPEKWTFNNEDLTIDNDNYRFNYHSNAVLDTLNLSYYYQNFKSELQPKDLTQYIKDKKEIDNTLSYGIYWNQSSQNIFGSDINLPMVSLALILTLICTFLAFYLYTRNTTPDIEAIKNAESIGGWLIIPAIGISFTPLTILYTTFKVDFFSETIWHNISLNQNAFLMQIDLVLSIFLNVVLFVFSILLIVLFYKKRDILPKYYIIFLILSLATMLLDTGSVILINKVLSKTENISESYFAILRRLIFAVVWIIYFIKSERVKRTFVISYPEHIWKGELFKEKLNSQFKSNTATETNISAETTDTDKEQNNE